MQVILLQDVKSLGRRGDIKEVSEGYARNFLFPKKIARTATESAVKEQERIEASKKMSEAKEKERILELVQVIERQKIIMKKEAKNSKLFGGIKAREVAQELKKSGLDISESCVIIKEPIKKVGFHQVDVELTKGIVAKLKLEVVEKK